MLCQEMETLSSRDRAVIWHPFTQAQIAEKPLVFSKGEGAYLFTEEGIPYLDGTSSWWVNLHGHAHPYISSKIAEQCHKLEHTLFTDFTHEPAILLAEQLTQALPPGFSRVFFSDNGSTAVESALKIAIQYWHNRGIKKTKILTLRGGYHGDTFGAMSLAGKSPFTLPFMPYLFEVSAIEPPFLGEEEKTWKQVDSLLDDSFGCFIYEPLIQGASGMRTYSQEGLEKLLARCRQKGLLLIADEVMTGFGRTGPLFASSFMKTLPDMIALSKGITGGFLPLGATLCREEIYAAFLSDKVSHALLHGHSYSGNPIACAAAIANLELLQREECREARQTIAKLHQAFCSKWKGHPLLKRLECFGTILILEYHCEASSYFSSLRSQLQRHFFSHHLLLRPLGNVLYVLPPYCTNEEDLERIYQTIEITLEGDSWKTI